MTLRNVWITSGRFYDHDFTPLLTFFKKLVVNIAWSHGFASHWFAQVSRNVIGKNEKGKWECGKVQCISSTSLVVLWGCIFNFVSSKLLKYILLTKLWRPIQSYNYATSLWINCRFFSPLICLFIFYSFFFFCACSARHSIPQFLLRLHQSFVGCHCFMSSTHKHHVAFIYQSS